MKRYCDVPRIVRTMAQTISRGRMSARGSVSATKIRNAGAIITMVR
jgi:hypothetical protein